MSNKVVTTLARAFARLGADAVRFNFRGVGARPAATRTASGEREDALAVVAWCRARWPGRRLYLGGFSFGAAVAAAIAARVAPAGLVTVAPPVDRLPADFVAPTLPVAAGARRGRRRRAAGSRARVVRDARQRRRGSCCCRASAIFSMADCRHSHEAVTDAFGADFGAARSGSTMLRKLSALFDSAFARDNDDAGAREHALRVATALLLIEVARADYADDFAEDATMLESLKQFFALDDAAAALLLEEARSSGRSRRRAPAVHAPLARAAVGRREAPRRRDAVAGGAGGPPARQARGSPRAQDRRAPIRLALRSHPHPQPRAAGGVSGARHSSTKNCFLNRTVNRLGSLARRGVDRIDEHLAVGDRRARRCSRWPCPRGSRAASSS